MGFIDNEVLDRCPIVNHLCMVKAMNELSNEIEEMKESGKMVPYSMPKAFSNIWYVNI